MYSNNDFRSYSENHLEHRHKSPYAGGFTADGKNTSEYNHDYYIKNLWRWGVEKAGETVDAAKQKINEAIDESDTQIDDKARELYRNSKRRVGQALDGIRSDARYRGTSSARDARVKADVAARNIQRNVSNAAQKIQSDARYKTTTAARNARVNADVAARSLKRNVDAAADNVKDRINTAVRNSNTKIDDNLLGVARALKNRDTNAAKNHLSNIGREIANTPENIKNRVNEAIDNSNTKVDDRLRSAYGAARSGNKAATGMYLRSAGKEAVKDINNAIDRSSTRVDDNLRGAYRAAKAGDTSAARTHLGNAGREIGRDARDFARNAAGAVYEGGRRAAGAAEKAVREGYGRLTNDRYDERNYTEGAQRRESNQGPNYNPREVGSDATLNERRQDEYNSRSINPQTGRLNRTATVNTNTERDNGDLTPIQKNRRQAEPEAPRRSLAGQNEMVTDSGTRSRYQKQRESNAGRNENVPDSGHRSPYDYDKSNYNRERNRGTLAGRNENASDAGTRSSRTRETENRYNNYEGMFENLAMEAGASRSAASQGVKAASSAIRKVVDALDMYGSDSRQYQRAYQEAMAEIMDEVRANNRGYNSNRFLPNNGNLNSRENIEYMNRSRRERNRNSFRGN